jgi:rhodanese-related sulfurtransferase
VSENDIEVTAEEARRRFAAGEVQVVDVREPEEWDAGRIPGDVQHIPLGELTGKAGSIDKDRPVVFQCRAGARSLMAAQAFRASGYDAYSLAGGLLAWEAAGYSLDPPDGSVAEH